MKSIQALCRADLNAVNQYINQELASSIGLVEDISQYIVNAGGKRLRPILVLLVARALNYQAPEAQHLAAIIECLHTATLLHDDVVDESAQRRGRPTAHINWGNASSILVGDFIYSRAFQMIVKLNNHEITATLAQATSEISEGEVQQLMNAGNVLLDDREYFATIQRKTATLFAAAAKSAALLAAQDAAMQQAMYDYGMQLGIAFQLVDDVLDYQGDPVTMGKNIGDDLSEGKMTLPLIYALDGANETDAQCIRDSIRNKDTSQLERIVQIVNHSDGIDRTLQHARDYCQQARQQLVSLAASPHRDALERLLDIAIERSS